MPPEATTRLPTSVPVPLRVAVLPTVAVEVPSRPCSETRPAERVVVPAMALVPVRVSAPAPLLIRAPVPVIAPA